MCTKMFVCSSACVQTVRLYLFHSYRAFTFVCVSFSKVICRRYNVGVSEHFVMAMEPLPNLSEQSARIGMWLLAVASDPRVEEYTYTKGTGKGKGKKFEVLLVSDDSDAYCLGQFRKKKATILLLRTNSRRQWKSSNGTLCGRLAKYHWPRATLSI